MLPGFNIFIVCEPFKNFMQSSFNTKTSQLKLYLLILNSSPTTIEDMQRF